MKSGLLHSSGVSIPNERQLIIISSGNADREHIKDFRIANLTDGIHDPGQSWRVMLESCVQR